MIAHYEHRRDQLPTYGQGSSDRLSPEQADGHTVDGMSSAARARVQSVTTAHAGRLEDVAARQRRYLLMMGIRIACLPLAVLVDGWARWIFIAGAVVLPYVAVVIANAVARPRDGTLTPAHRVPRAALPASSTNGRDSSRLGTSGRHESV